MKAVEIKSAVEKGEITLIDIRDIRLWNEGTIKDQLHIPRGMLEFWLILKIILPRKIEK